MCVCVCTYITPIIHIYIYAKLPYSIVFKIKHLRYTVNINSLINSFLLLALSVVVVVAVSCGGGD